MPELSRSRSRASISDDASSDRSRRVRLASASEVTLCGQRLRYLPHGQRPKDAPHQPGFSILRAGGPELVALAEQVERIDIEIDIGGI